MGVGIELLSMTHGTDRRGVVDRIDSKREQKTDDVAELLSDPHCRYLLQYLKENENPASVASLTEYVVSEITDTPPHDVDEDVKRRVQTWLHHGQLPTLDKYDVVEFDAEDGRVSLHEDSRL
jgi:hypothetical protein